MNKDEIEELFANINMIKNEIENEIEQITDSDLYEYVVNCITNNEWASIENYEEFRKR